MPSGWLTPGLAGQVRQILQHLGAPKPEPLWLAPEAPLYDQEELLGVLPTNNHTSYDVREARQQPLQPTQIKKATDSVF